MSKARRFSDVYDGDSPLWKGERVKTEDLIDKEMEIKKVSFETGMRNSRYVRVQAQVDGKTVIFTTSAQIVMQQLEGIEEQLPVIATLKKKEGKRWLYLE